MSDTDIAVVGVGCRFPDAWTPAQFWRNIDQGVVSMRELTDEELRAAGVSEEAASAPTTTWPWARPCPAWPTSPPSSSATPPARPR